MFDSGLAAVLDVLDFANALTEQARGAPSRHVTVIGLQPEIRTGARYLVTTEPAARAETADLLRVPARAVRRPAAHN